MLRDRASAGNKKREGEKVFTEDRLSKELLYTCIRNNKIKRKHAGNPTNSSLSLGFELQRMFAQLKAT